MSSGGCPVNHGEAASSSPASTSSSVSSVSGGGCPVNHGASKPAAAPPAPAAASTGGCPVQHKPVASSSEGCPVMHSPSPSTSSSASSAPSAASAAEHSGFMSLFGVAQKKDAADGISSSASSSSSSSATSRHSSSPDDVLTTNGGAVNPLNMMPALSQELAHGQKKQLNKERQTSSIPQGGANVIPGYVSDETAQQQQQRKWVYPSEQMFFNALKRKGWETEEDDIGMMLYIHNELNEKVWQELLRWESMHKHSCPNPRLAKFTGRPQDLSPRARFYSMMNIPPPFDRHDWYVDRCGKQVRYVIDYYSGHDEPGVAVMNVDLRPALDSPGAVFDRMRYAVFKYAHRWFGWGFGPFASSSSSENSS